MSKSLSDFMVQTFTNPEEALEQAKTSKPDLILTDYNLKGITGFELCKKLQMDAATVEIPIVFLADFDEVEMAKEAFEYGAIDFIDKVNLRPEIVRLRVENALKLNESMRDGKSLESNAKKFLRVICHDVATPLSVVKTCIELVKEESRDFELSERHRFAIDRLSKNAASIERILDDVRSSHARSEKGETLPVENVQLNKVIAEAVDNLKERIERKNLFVDIFPIDD